MYQRNEVEIASPAPSSANGAALSDQVSAFPSTRFMGSKEQLLLSLWSAISPFAPRRVLDLCSGSGVVSYMLKAQGCAVVANDQMKMARVIADALVSNSHDRLAVDEINSLAELDGVLDGLIWETYGDLYFSKDDVAFLDAARLQFQQLGVGKKDVALAALVRSCIKRRPRGIFTYTGHRYDDGRKDLRMSLREHFRQAATEISSAVFDNGKRSSTEAVDLTNALPKGDFDLVYLDPPYFSPLSDNEYVRRYHFTEALARDWVDVDVQWETKTKKLRNYPNPFRSEISAVGTIGRVLDAYKSVPVILSYSSNSLPDAETLLKIMRQHGRKAKVVEVDHRYSFANQAAAKSPVRNKVKELIFTAE